MSELETQDLIEQRDKAKAEVARLQKRLNNYPLYNRLADRVDKAEAEVARLRERIADYEEKMSEVVTPPEVEVVGEGVRKWKRNLGNGNYVDVMRGDPKLDEFIVLLHQQITDCVNDLEAKDAEVARLRASNREYIQQANQARDAAADELHNQTQDLIEQRDEARAAARHIFDLLSRPALPKNCFMHLVERWPWLEDEYRGEEDIL